MVTTIVSNIKQRDCLQELFNNSSKQARGAEKLNVALASGLREFTFASHSHDKISTSNTEKLRVYA